MYIGIDAGATKTHFVLSKDGQNIYKEYIGPGSSFTTMDASFILSYYKKVITAFLSFVNEPITRVVIGLSGIDTPQELSKAKKLFAQLLSEDILNITVMNDLLIPLLGASENKNAIALVSGTGSNCIGKNAQNKLSKTGGFDFLLSDMGSAFAIGLDTLKYATKVFDGRAYSKYLLKELFSYFEVKDFFELKHKIYNPLLSKKQIASISSVTLSLATKGDKVCIDILTKQAKELAFMVLNTAKNLSFIKDIRLSNEKSISNINFDLILVGSMLTKSELYKSMFLSSLNMFDISFDLVLPKEPPALLAVYIAHKIG